jgi:hypothetical protein
MTDGVLPRSIFGCGRNVTDGVSSIRRDFRIVLFVNRNNILQTEKDPLGYNVVHINIKKIVKSVKFHVTSDVVSYKSGLIYKILKY